MSTSELITPRHLARKAIIYVRQSTPHQAISHQESLRLQYALEQRAVTLGWRPEEVVVIDADIGVSASSADLREGFKEVLAQVTLGQVGILLSYDVTRLARNCSDWYPLLDVCGYRGCLIADHDGIYDPGSPNGRLLLGLNRPASYCTSCCTYPSFPDPSSPDTQLSGRSRSCESIPPFSPTSKGGTFPKYRLRSRPFTRQ